MDKLNGAQLLVDCLVKHDVKYVFGIPGAKIDAVFDALLDSPIEIILCRHEQNAAFMAAAYGRLTGQPGIVLVTSGPGVTNLTTGLLTATTEGDPVIAIGGNVSRIMKFKASHQNAENVKIMESVTKKSYDILVTDHIAEVVEEAFRIATEPKRGAVFLSFPQDVLTEVAKVSLNQPMPHYKLAQASPDVINEAASLINEAKLPILLLGMEASNNNHAHAIQELLRIRPFATIETYQAAGVVSRDLVDCFVGRVGLFRNQPGDKLIDAADVILTIGYDTVEYDPHIWNRNRNKVIIHLANKAATIDNAYFPALEVLGDITANIEQLKNVLVCRCIKEISAISKTLHDDLFQQIAQGAQYDGAPMHPLRFIHDLREVMDDNATIISDIGTHYMWLARYFLSYKPHHLLFSNGQQTLGVALPWAIATRLVRPRDPIISISGDGGFLFSAMELETAVRLKLNLVHCVWCDGAYNMVYEQQLMKYKRGSAVAFGAVDLVKHAESYGSLGLRVNHADEFIPLLKQALAHTGPVIIEIPIDYSHNKELFIISDETNLN